MLVNAYPDPANCTRKLLVDSSSTTRASHFWGKKRPMDGCSSASFSGAPRAVISWQKDSRPYFSMAKRSDLLSVRLTTPGMMATALDPMLCARPPHDAMHPKRATTAAPRGKQKEVSALLMSER